MRLHVFLYVFTTLFTACAIAHAPPLYSPKDSNPFQTADGYDPEDIASLEDWTRYQAKGSWFNCGLLPFTDGESGKRWNPYNLAPPSSRSIWPGNMNDLLLWNWLEGDYNQLMHCNFQNGNGANNAQFEEALTALGLSAKSRQEGGDNQCWSIEHFEDDASEDDDRTYKVGPATYKWTEAFVRFGINYRGGAIFMNYYESTKFAARNHWHREPTAAELPAIRAASDILWTYWQRDNPNIRNLRYYFAVHILNAETLQLVARIMYVRNLDVVPLWPGLELEMGENTFEALLGSPIGATVGFLLVQHKAQLGIKRVGSITVFRDHVVTPAYSVHMVFEIEDVPPEDIDNLGDPMDLGRVIKRSRAVEVWDGRNVVRVHDVLAGRR